MRNWNAKLARPVDEVELRFQPTYEELKPILPIQPEITARRFQPTYEELKPFWRYTANLFPVLFSAYLWGIETNNLRGYARYGLRFQPTYEELKQNRAAADPRRPGRFQPTYEELKLL